LALSTHALDAEDRELDGTKMLPAEDGLPVNTQYRCYRIGRFTVG
jgi:hypothetical protein